MPKEKFGQIKILKYLLGFIGISLFLLLLFLLNIRKNSKIERLDLDNDGIFEEFLLDNGVLTISKAGRQLFQSNISWQVNKYAWGDSNNDGEPELNIGFWRVGDFVKQNPFTRTRRDPLSGYHLNLYRYQPNTLNFYLLWGSSTLNDPLYSFDVSLGTDNINYLSVSTGTYKEFDEKGYINPVENSMWVWDNWWFVKVD